MEIGAAAQKLYQLKNAFVSHTGAIGRGLEKAVARKWIHDIEHSIDEEVKGDPAMGLSESSTGAFAEFRRRSGEGRLPSVGIALQGFAIGGGEIFPIQLSNCLWKMGLPVILIDCGRGEEDPKARSMVDPSVPVLHLQGLSFLPFAVRCYGLQVLHSHHAAVDLAIARARSMGKINAGLVITLHGMYEALDRPRRELLVREVSPSADFFAYIADKNLEPFREAGIRVDDRFVKIDNGLPAGTVPAVSRQSLGIGENDFVFCLVSRAIPEKGWFEAVKIVQLANRKSDIPIHLILVGGGEDCEALKGVTDPHIHLVGEQQNTRQYLMASDMGFLPSRYAGESFPLSLIDSFMCGKPVIASSLGEIPKMVETGSGRAGYLFDLTSDGAIPVEQVADEVVKIAGNPDLYQRMQCAAGKAAARYDIRNTAKEYLKLYRMASRTVQRDSLPDVKILISCHKPAAVLHSDVLQPIQVGTALAQKCFPGMLHDNEGDNISALNRSYCELTAQYYAWKNMKAEYFGFFHYRRYLSFSDQVYREDRYGNVYEPAFAKDRHFLERYGWTDGKIRAVMKEYDVVTVKGRRLGKEDAVPSGNGEILIPHSILEQYAAAPYLRGEDLLRVLDIIRSETPEYYQDALDYLNGDIAYYCNMYVCRADLFDAYCTWLFRILKEFCDRTDMSGYDEKELRTPGHLAERLWGVYYTKLKKSGQYRIRELQSVVFADTNPDGSSVRTILRPVLKVLHGVTG